MNSQANILLSRSSHRPGIKAFAVLLVAGSFCFGESSGGPVIPGLLGKHPLTDSQRGDLLLSELRCAACHEGIKAEQMKLAPDLTHVGSRLTHDFLEKFIANPASVHPGTTMPDMLGGESEEKRAEIAGSLAAFLATLRKDVPAEPRPADADPVAGKDLFHSVGCVACHSPRDEAGSEIVKEGVLSLSHLPGKYLPGELASFLQAPLKIRPSGRMPDMNLSKEESAALAAYLDTKPASAPEQKPLDPNRVGAGKQAFISLNCVACHQVEKGGPKLLDLPAKTLDLTKGCLSDEPGSAPDFQLSADQKTVIRKALEEPKKESTPADSLKLQLTRLNCISCHVRDDFGGVAQHLDTYFHSTQEALGNEARIPPPLTLTGAKLRPEWLNAVLYDGRTVRPYMTTRMPQFGELGLTGMLDAFANVDKLEPLELAEPDEDSNRAMREGAVHLLGDKGLACIACHNYNGMESPGMKGLDLMTSFQRLQPGWFSRFMQNPAAYRPGIIMPNYWPDGKAVQTEILGGDTELQLRALWYNFSLGRSAGTPSGLRSEPSILEVKDKVVTYRGRSNVAGYRGIAVGFPNKMNYAFNAHNGAFSAIWHGQFVNVGWQGQGSGNFNPMEQPVQLAQDVAFLQGSEVRDPWPLLPQITKEQPINLDPLYPKNHGYAFLGYSMDASHIPTFEYRCGPVLILDKSSTPAQGEAKILRRQLEFTAPEKETIWFRALTGKIEAKTETIFQTPDIKLTFPTAKTILRPGPKDEQELLIELPLPQGKSHFTIDYELLH